MQMVAVIAPPKASSPGHLLKHRRKFTELVEQLAERRMARNEALQVTALAGKCAKFHMGTGML